MKITKHGVLPKNPLNIYSGKCVKCNCIVEVNENEIRYDSEYNHYYIWCPTQKCNSIIVVVFAFKEKSI